ncbi:MAG: DUF4321 domain-containing protein [Lachnospiraceae bacterium]|nr:DUF4321 domain-containing protein [Lachnospiraceae bacterium]
MKKIAGKNGWTCLIFVMAGIVLGGFLGTLMPNSLLNYGQTFGMTSPMVLDLGILTITFAFTIRITVASIIGIIIALFCYRIL